jgi:hypothetical protein
MQYRGNSEGQMMDRKRLRMLPYHIMDGGNAAAVWKNI